MLGLFHVVLVAGNALQHPVSRPKRHRREGATRRPKRKEGGEEQKRAHVENVQQHPVQKREILRHTRGERATETVTEKGVGKDEILQSKGRRTRQKKNKMRGGKVRRR